MGQLRRGDVLAGALELLDAEGLDRLTMRRLAERLQVQAGALYWHFPSKQALLEAMADEILAGLVGEGPLEPVPGLVDLARRLRAVLLRHPDGARVVAGTFVTQANTRAAGEACMAATRAAGLPPVEAARVGLALFSFVVGHTIEEQGLTSVPDAERTKRVGSLSGMTTDAQVLLDELTGDPSERFEFGLKLLLDGVRALPSGGGGA